MKIAEFLVYGFAWSCPVTLLFILWALWDIRAELKKLNRRVDITGEDEL